ncbi:MAG: hypothetical protein IIA87_02165 [Nanoarchaeota archaeon]|nr:hypothetical protein [Nanoarchaeota archaeon]
MRRIKSPEEIEKSQKRMKVLVGGSLIFLMVFSVVGFALFSGGSSFSDNQNSNQDQNNFNFNGRYWVFNSGGQEFYFTNPQELTKDIPVNINMNINNYAGVPLYLVSDSDEVLNEISINLARYASRFQIACYKSCEEDLPEKTCEENLIVWQEGEENKVYQEENCIFIEGDLLAVDAFLYRILGF